LFIPCAAEIVQIFCPDREVIGNGIFCASARDTNVREDASSGGNERAPDAICNIRGLARRIGEAAGYIEQQSIEIITDAPTSSAEVFELRGEAQRTGASSR